MAATGELDLTTAPTLQARVASELEAGHEVELDLSRVPFVDSSGLGALVALARRADELGVAFALLTPLPPQMRRVLDVTGLGERLPLAPTPTPR